MGVEKIILRPGINGQASQTLNEGGYSRGNMIRFRDGLAEKRRGWIQDTTELFAGTCRGLLSWTQLNQVKDVAAGTNLRLYIYQGGMYYDITPVVDSGTLALDPFTTTLGSDVVTVHDVNHLRSVGDYVIFDGATAVGGLTIDGEYTVASVIDADNYTIVASGVASSSATGGGAAVLYTYLLGVGYADATPLYGWGGGGWGLGPWGTPRTQPATTIYPRTWSLDHWGEDLLANPFSLGIYYWTVTGGLSSRAVALTNAPTQCNYCLVGVPERHVIAFGCEVSGVFDPLLIRWTDVESLTIWTASATNSAGSFRLGSGNQVMMAMKAASSILVLTDKSCWAMTFQGLPFVYGFKEIGPSAGAISPDAGQAHGAAAYWMHQDAFYQYQGGAVRQLPCSVWAEVFENINREQQFKVASRLNSGRNEILWYFPSSESTENDMQVCYNYIDNTWDVSEIERTAGIDNEVFTYPLAVDTSGLIYNEEYGYDANGAALGDYIETGYFDISAGEEFIFVDQFIPDFGQVGPLAQVGDVELTLYFKEEPNGDAVVDGPHTLSPTTRIAYPRGRARQVAFRIASVGLGSFWRMGAPRYRGQPDGRN